MRTKQEEKQKIARKNPWLAGKDSKGNILSEMTKSASKQVAAPPAKHLGSLVGAGFLLQSNMPALARPLQAVSAYSGPASNVSPDL